MSIECTEILVIVLCLMLVIVLLIMWVDSKQQLYKYISKPISSYDNYMAQSKDTSDCSKTVYEKHKNMMDPEKEVMVKHTLGTTFNNSLKKVNDSLVLEGVQTVTTETKDDMVMRSFDDAGDEGVLLEGMTAPVDEFERRYMDRQINKNQEIYGEQHYDRVSADLLSSLNM
jgi:hypothetical protein